jgi:phosphomannomutase
MPARAPADAPAPGASRPAPIATHSGVRGRLGRELTGEQIDRATRALAAVVCREGRSLEVGVGRDGRRQSATVARRVIATLSNHGLDVVDFAVAATPTVKLASRRHALGGAIVVTGSHLGPEWTGLKLLAGPSLLPVDIREVEDEPTHRFPRRRGVIAACATAADEHAAAISATLDLSGVGSLAVGFLGGAGEATRRTLAGIGCRFSEAHRDVTLCLDADGDRLELIDEDGARLDSEVTFALACAATTPPSLVRSADTSRMAEIVSGARAYVTTPGELHVLRELLAREAAIAGEGNGGVVIPAVGPARDAFATSAVLLAQLARAQAPLSALAAELPRLFRERSTVPCAGAADARLALERAAGVLAVDFADPEAGVAVQEEAGAWGLIRQSATEPVLRFTAEAMTPAIARDLHRRLRAAAASDA